MLFKKIEIENIGPISDLTIEFPKDHGDTPKPLVIVGENGSGKSILLAHLVNTLISGKQKVYDDVEVEKGKLFKYRSPLYIQSEKTFSFSKVEFETGDTVKEWQLIRTRKSFEENLGYTPLRKEWNEIPIDESSYFSSSFNSQSENTKEIFKNQCCLYFPVNRFEEPAWLNLENLQSKAVYSDLKKISGYSNRDIICTSPLKNNINWLLDIIFDSTVFDMKVVTKELVLKGKSSSDTFHILEESKGQSTNIYFAILHIVRMILKADENIRLGAGNRQNRQVSVIKDEQVWVPNLFQLSTGEVQLINLFLSIIRDYDLSEGKFDSLDDIKGIVIIDEIDAHLHATHQKNILPKLIKSFPNIQFIITSHAPLFLIGMEAELGEDGFEILNMPSGEKLVASDFSEFIVAYEAFKSTTSHREEINKEIEKHSKPIVFVEGVYDIRYLNKASELLGRTDILDSVQLIDGDGFGNLDKIWRNFKNSISKVVPNKMILLYDCDTNKQDTNSNMVFKRVIPFNKDNPIKIGIENLFNEDTIDKVIENKPQYIDIKQASLETVRGKQIEIPALKSVNKDEKGNMCDWLCKNGTIEDFANFVIAFEVIDKVINS